MQFTRLQALVLAAAVSGVLIGVTSPLYASQDVSMPAQMTHQNSGDKVNANARYEIQSRFSTDSVLNNTQLNTTVTDDSIVLTGYVNNQEQRDEALSIAQSYAGDRTIVNNIQVGGIAGW